MQEDDDLRMSHRDRPRIWRTAYYLLHDVGASALPINEVMITSRRYSGGNTMHCWAMDIRALIPEHLLHEVDNHYLQPSNEYRRIPMRIRLPLRAMWRMAERRGLYKQGLWIVDQLHG